MIQGQVASGLSRSIHVAKVALTHFCERLLRGQWLVGDGCSTSLHRMACVEHSRDYPQTIAWAYSLKKKQ